MNEVRGNCEICQNQADVYAMGGGANDWGGRYCNAHIPKGFFVTDRYGVEQFRCPRCWGYIPNNEQIGQFAGAISRRDNKTEICSSCGIFEAFEDFDKASAWRVSK